MIKRLLILSSLLYATPVIAASVCVELSDVQIQGIQKMLDVENAQGKTRYSGYVLQTVTDYVQRTINPVVDSLVKKQKEEELINLSNLLQYLSLPAQQELIAALMQKVQIEKGAQ